MKDKTREYRSVTKLLRRASILASAMLLLGNTHLVLAREAAALDSKLTREASVIEAKTVKAYSVPVEPAPVEPEPALEPVFLPVPYHSQVTETSIPNACGPTSMLMAMEYLGHNESLQDIINRLQSISPTEGGYDPQCINNPVCTSPRTLAGVTEGYGLDVDAAEGWTLEDVRSSLSEGRPIIADITWRLMEGGPGHFVVIYGVDSDAEMVYYHDPYDGAARAATWEAFSGSWDGPVDVNDPLQPEGHRSWGVAIGIEG